MPRGVYGNARIGAEPQQVQLETIPLLMQQVTQLETMARAVRAFRAAKLARDKQPWNQTCFDLGEAARRAVELGIPTDEIQDYAAADAYAAVLEAKAANLRRALAALAASGTGLPPPSMPKPPMPKPPAPQQPGAPQMPQAQPPAPSQGPQTMPPPPPPPPPPEVHGLGDVRNRVRFEWEQVPKKERSAIEIAAYAIGALALTAGVIAIARR